MAKTAVDYLLHTGAAFPDKACYVDGDRPISFGMALARAKAVGSCLVKRGVFRKPVAVLMERSGDCMLAQQGVMQAGGYYVPLDPQMPPERVRLILDKVKPAALLADKKNWEKAERYGDVPALAYGDACQTPVDEGALCTVQEKLSGEDLAYVLFTSGSTGMPKGVAGTHRALMNYVDSACDMLGVTERTVFGNAAPCYFVLAFLDMYGALKTGATTYLIPKKCFLFPKLMLPYLNDNRIDTVFFAPTALMNISSSGILEREQPRYLKTVLFAGEVMRTGELNVWRKALPDTRFYNYYGSTETTGVVLSYLVDRDFAEDEALPAGRPCANNLAFLLDENDCPVADGETGELCVVGPSLASGYVGERAKTAAVFTESPLHPGTRERMFRTGDRMRKNAFGEYVFSGRKDAMVKHLGYRVELGEMETAIGGLPGVEQVCCLHREAGDLLLCAYVGSIEEKQLLVGAKERLPQYMLPNRIYRLDDMAKTPNGKIDRMALTQHLVEKDS